MPIGNSEAKIVCPVCQGLDVHVKGKKDLYSLVECDTCGLRFSDPMTTDHDFYLQSIDYQFRDSTIVDPLAWERRWDIERFLQALPSRRGALLDIGCGTGFFVRRARDYGFDAHGLEMDGRAIENGRAYFGLQTIYQKTLDAFLDEDQNRRFQVVTLFQVLEHLEDPLHVLKQVRKILDRDGVLVLSLPWFERWPDVLGEMDLPPHHLTRWTAGALRTALQLSGFQIRDLVIEKFPLQNMVGLVYRAVHRIAPFLTATGSFENKKSKIESHNINSDGDALLVLTRRKLKIKFGLMAVAPLWAALKLLGAKGPHLYVEAIPGK